MVPDGSRATLGYLFILYLSLIRERDLVMPIFLKVSIAYLSSATFIFVNKRIPLLLFTHFALRVSLLPFISSLFGAISSVTLLDIYPLVRIFTSATSK